MSRYSYAGEFKNPADRYFVKEVGERFQVWVRHDREADGSCPPDRPMNARGGTPTFDEADEAQDYIDSIREGFEEDYSDYLEEHRYEINLMERYEAFRNEY
jgi:hypothetical protein